MTSGSDVGPRFSGAQSSWHAGDSSAAGGEYVAWTVQRARDEVLAALDAAQVPAGRIYSVADIAADAQYRVRDMIVPVVTSGGQPLKVPDIVPKLSATPGAIRHAAPRLGEHDGDLQGPGWPAR